MGWIVVTSWILVCVLLIVIVKIGNNTININDKYESKNINDNINDKLNPITKMIASSFNIRDKPLIIQIDSVVTFKEKLKYRSIQEIRILKDDELKHRSFIVKWFHLFVIKLRNDHMWAGIFCRDWGTSFTYNQRIAILMTRLLTTMATAAMFNVFDVFMFKSVQFFYFSVFTWQNKLKLKYFCVVF